MSFEINWDLLKNGEEALKLKEFLNCRFQEIERPNFLGQISVSNLEFGNIPPEIAVVNITDPMEEFYLEEYDEMTNSNGSYFIERNESMSEYSGEIRQLEKSEMDAQVELSIQYNGDMTMSISTELIVNQPTPNFLTLPLTLTLTKMSLKATAVIAYMQDRINFCLKEPGKKGIFRDLAIESAIGDNSKQGNSIL